MSAIAIALAAQQEQRRRQVLLNSFRSKQQSQKDGREYRPAQRGRQAPASTEGMAYGDKQQQTTGALTPPAAGPCRSQRQAEAVLRRLHPTATFLTSAQHSRRPGLTPLGGLASGAPAVPPPGPGGQWRKPLPWAHLAQQDVTTATAETIPDKAPQAAGSAVAGREDTGSSDPWGPMRWVVRWLRSPSVKSTTTNANDKRTDDGHDDVDGSFSSGGGSAAATDSRTLAAAMGLLLADAEPLTVVFGRLHSKDDVASRAQHMAELELRLLDVMARRNASAAEEGANPPDTGGACHEGATGSSGDGGGGGVGLQAKAVDPAPDAAQEAHRRTAGQAWSADRKLRSFLAAVACNNNSSGSGSSGGRVTGPLLVNLIGMPMAQGSEGPEAADAVAVIQVVRPRLLATALQQWERRQQQQEQKHQQGAGGEGECEHPQQQEHKPTGMGACVGAEHAAAADSCALAGLAWVRLMTMARREESRLRALRKELPGEGLRTSVRDAARWQEPRDAYLAVKVLRAAAAGVVLLSSPVEGEQRVSDERLEPMACAALALLFAAQKRIRPHGGLLPCQLYDCLTYDVLPTQWHGMRSDGGVDSGGGGGGESGRAAHTPVQRYSAAYFQHMFHMLVMEGREAAAQLHLVWSRMLKAVEWQRQQQQQPGSSEEGAASGHFHCTAGAEAEVGAAAQELDVAAMRFRLSVAAAIQQKQLQHPRKQAETAEEEEEEEKEEEEEEQGRRLQQRREIQLGTVS